MISFDCIVENSQTKLASGRMVLLSELMTGHPIPGIVIQAKRLK
jgi:hypothetical protein